MPAITRAQRRRNEAAEAGSENEAARGELLGQAARGRGT